MWGLGALKYFEHSVFENDNDTMRVGLNYPRYNNRPSQRNLKIKSENDLWSPTEAISSM